MALIYTEDQKLLKESAAGFFAEQSPITAFRQLRDSNDETGYSTDLWTQMIDMGFTSLLLSEDDGGTGFGYVGAGIVAEEMAKTLTPSPFISSAIVATELLKSYDSDKLNSVAQGEKIATLAIDETGHHTPDTVRTKAVLSGDQWHLTGYKTFVPDGHVADYLLVTAKTDGETIGLFIVEKNANSLIIDKSITTDSRNWAKITLESTPATLLGKDASSAVAQALDKANCVLSAELLGLSQAAFEMTQAYLKERKQFGQIIGTFQGLQHRSAHLFSEIEITRSMVLAALQAQDAKAKHAALLASAAKARASKTAELATNEAIQMHGGIGMTDEYDVGFFIKRARSIQSLYGGQHYHTNRFAVLNGY